MATLKQYCDYLFAQGGLETEAVHLIDAVTTNKTEFFREPDHFRFLAERVVPRLISGREGWTDSIGIESLERGVLDRRGALHASPWCSPISRHK